MCLTQWCPEQWYSLDSTTHFQPVVLSSGRVLKLSTPTTSLSYNIKHLVIHDKFIHVQGRVFVHDSSLTTSLYHFWVRDACSETLIGVNFWIWTFQYWDIISTKRACISWNSGWDFISVVVDDVTVLWVWVVRYGRKEQNQWTSDQ